MRLALIAVFVVLAGCTGTPTGPATDAPTRTATPTATPVTSPTTPTGSPHVTTVDYADLSAEAQTAFDVALDGEARFLPDSPHVEGESFSPDAAGEFGSADYVRKNGTRYAVSFREGDLYASYSLYADPATPGENATVVAYENLSANVSAQVRWAVENGSHDVPLGKWHSLPSELGDVQYVRYDGEAYRMSYAVGDYWVRLLEFQAET